MSARRRSAPAKNSRGGVLEATRPGDSATRARVSEMQRSRLLAAAVAVVEELGYTRTTVANITSRARVSRRTFYDLFPNREECLLAVLEGAVTQITAELEAADLDGLAWRERVREGLWLILCFFDREPALARLCVVQSGRGSQRVLERRAEVLAALAGVLEQGRHEGSKTRECPPLAAEGLVGAALSILYTRLLKREPEPLSDLLGELMGLIVLPYVGSAAAHRERMRPLPPTPADAPAGRVGPGTQDGLADPLGGLPMRLTYRTARVLEDIAMHPGVSNRAVADRAGIFDQGQISKLLARLERLGLLQNTGEGHVKGEPNAWQLTPVGQNIVQNIRSNARQPQHATR